MGVRILEVASGFTAAIPTSPVNLHGLSVRPTATRAFANSEFKLHLRSQPLQCFNQVSKQVTFHSGETAVTIPFSKETAVPLRSSLDAVLETFRKKETSTPRRWESTEFKYRKDDMILEFFCNPNAYPDAFKMNVTSEALLSAIKSDVDHFVEMYS